MYDFVTLSVPEHTYIALWITNEEKVHNWYLITYAFLLTESIVLYHIIQHWPTHFLKI
jgi:hypothetical protein